VLSVARLWGDRQRRHRRHRFECTGGRRRLVLCFRGSSGKVGVALLLLRVLGLLAVRPSAQTAGFTLAEGRKRNGFLGGQSRFFVVEEIGEFFGVLVFGDQILDHVI